MLLTLFVLTVLIVVGLFAFVRGEGTLFLAVVAVVALALIAAAPMVATLNQSFQDAVNAALPLAMRQ